jgi:hypothetical protein
VQLLPIIVSVNFAPANNALSMTTLSPIKQFGYIYIVTQDNVITYIAKTPKVYYSIFCTLKEKKVALFRFYLILLDCKLQ